MIRILLELITPVDNHPVLSGLSDAFDTCSPIRIACLLPEAEGDNVDEARHCCACRVGKEDKIRFSEGASPAMREALEKLLAGPVESPRIVKIPVNDRDCEVYVESAGPPAHLLILGGGPDVQPLTGNAALLGWQITVLDHRAAYANPEKFPQAATVARVDAADALDAVDVETVSAVILMSHHFPTDCIYLRQVLDTHIPFIGLLGPRIRGIKLFEEIDADWEAEQSRVHSPAGLDIGGESPEAIALSIVVEIQSFIEDRHGQPLKDRKTGIHD